MNQDILQKKYIIISSIALVIVIFLLIWLVVFIQSARRSQVVAPQKKTPSTTDASLGGQIFEKTQNPLQGKLPDTNPVKNANPIEGAYTNPF